jgi:hypothetical protein
MTGTRGRVAGPSAVPGEATTGPRGVGGWRRRFVLAGVGIVVVAAVAVMVTSRSSDDEPLARLAVLDRSVNVRPSSIAAFGPASTGRPLSVGDTIRTDRQGRAQVDYTDGSLTRLDRATTFVVEELARADRPAALRVRVDLGRTWNEVADLTTSGERFQSATTNAVATVRGTVFMADQSRRGLSTFAVAEGTVEVVTRTGVRILLHAGERVTVLPDGTLGPLETVVFAQLASQDEWIRFNLQHSTGVAGSTTTTAAPMTTSSTLSTGTTTAGAGPTTTAAARSTTTRGTGTATTVPTSNSTSGATTLPTTVSTTTTGAPTSTTTTTTDPTGGGTTTTTATTTTTTTAPPPTTSTTDPTGGGQTTTTTTTIPRRGG